MQPDLMHTQKSPGQPPLPGPLPHAGEGDKVSLRENHDSGLYVELMAHAAGLPNDELFAQMITGQATRTGALPPGLGLKPAEFSTLLARHYPGIKLAVNFRTIATDPRAIERDDVLALLRDSLTGKDRSEQWMAEIVTTACMASDHLWQDLGLWSRDDLSRLMTENFPFLAAKNIHDMKWKKFLYKQLCEREGINACRAPSCEYCADYLKCFGPEE